MSTEERDPRLSLSSLAAVKRAAACRDRDQFEWERWDGYELLRAAAAHIDAQAEQLRRAKAREAAYEAVLWMAERYAEGDRNDADTLAGWMRQVEANR